MLSRRGLMLLLAAQSEPVEIRLICAAPSPYTQRRDSYRAGAGILLCLRQWIARLQLPVVATYYDASPLLGRPAELKALLRGPRVLLVGTSVWGQGPSSVGRQFLEAVNTESIAGTAATSWVTSGGAHTGGAMAWDSNLATLRSMGAAVFSFGQKQMVFTTDERLTGEKPGEFTLLDVWFMEGLAKAALVQALYGGSREKAAALWKQLDSNPNYYLGYFPKSIGEIEGRLGEILKRINAAAAPKSEARQGLDALVKESQPQGTKR